MGRVRQEGAGADNLSEKGVREREGERALKEAGVDGESKRERSVEMRQNKLSHIHLQQLWSCMLNEPVYVHFLSSSIHLYLPLHYKVVLVILNR